ncbi:Mitochondrial-processing peptidase subunit alpha [Dimargaris xerosporica]|nr:Mitochondrial-processing peptidase subunit alpha [Dimargaris xerosporica]
MLGSTLFRHVSRPLVAKSPATVLTRQVRTTTLRKAVGVDSIFAVDKAQTEAETLAKITTLPNGVRIATQNTPGYFCGLGVYVDAGSRCETPATSGSCHLIDRLAFKSTRGLSAEQVNHEVESMGANFQRASSRENILYQASVFRSDLPRVVALMAEVTRHPQITPEELDEQRQIVTWELAEMQTKPELMLPELLHQTAYRGNTLGRPLQCSEDRLLTVQPQDIHQFMTKWFTADRMVIAAIGAPHDQVCELVERHFGDMKPCPSFTGHRTVKLDALKPEDLAPKAAMASPDSNSSDSLWNSFTHTATKVLGQAGAPQLSPLDQASPTTIANLPAEYTGGMHLQSDPTATFSHLHLGFEAPGMSTPAIYALAVLQILLGGGDSFSAGGPGKGMYSRLYTQVLNRYMFVESCMAFTYSYRDTSLFGISAACDPRATGSMLEIMIQQLVSLLPPPPRDSSHYDYYPTHESLSQDSSVATRYAMTCRGLDQTEVSRAKNQLKSSLMMNLESRPIQLEDLGRQVQGFGVALTPQEMCRFIDQVTTEDLYRLVHRVLSSKPTLVATGNVSDLKSNAATLLKSYGIRA